LSEEGAAFKGSGAYQRQYAALLIQVKSVNEEVIILIIFTVILCWIFLIS
jgi:hypothetical protein